MRRFVGGARRASKTAVNAPRHIESVGRAIYRADRRSSHWWPWGSRLRRLRADCKVGSRSANRIPQTVTSSGGVRRESS